MAKEKEINLLNIENTQSENKEVKQDKEVSPMPQQDNKSNNKTENKGNDKKDENAAQNTQKEYKNLESFKESLNPQEKKILEKFMTSPVFDSFVTYLETFFRDKDMIIHRINCYSFRAKEDVKIRIHGKFYEIKKNEVIYIQKDSFGNAMLRNDKLERIL